MNRAEGIIYSGAAALTTLHERHMREFLATWREAVAQGLELPPSDDPNLETLDTLLAHVLGCSARYLNWICVQLGLPERVERDRPPPEGLAERADDYLASLLRAWAGPLEGLTEKRAYAPVHVSRWGVPYCLDAMLEHAVMHPLRHSHQLRRLMAARGG